MHAFPRYGKADDLDAFPRRHGLARRRRQRHVLSDTSLNGTPRGAPDRRRLFHRYLAAHSLLIGLLPFFVPVYLWQLGLSLAGLCLLVGASGLAFSATLIVWQRLARARALARPRRADLRARARPDRLRGAGRTVARRRYPDAQRAGRSAGRAVAGARARTGALGRDARRPAGRRSQRRLQRVSTGPRSARCSRASAPSATAVAATATCRSSSPAS